MSAALFYIPYTPLSLDNWYGVQRETHVATRIIAAGSRGCKDFFRIPVDTVRHEPGSEASGTPQAHD
jgi:hypothetical protein